MTFLYDVIVVGAGHAGCEAARATARIGAHTLLITMDLDKTAQMSCNPAVGGIAKGQIVREIDALGGVMGVITDRATLQFRMLNSSKGPAMWSPRAQCDRRLFSALWRSELEHTDNLQLMQDNVVDLVTVEGSVNGVKTASGFTFHAPKVILTNGTFLNGLMHIGDVQTPGGRTGEMPSRGLTERLAALGHTPGRMKTGTPPRIDIRSVDLSFTDIQQGDPLPGRFTFLTGINHQLPQLPCYALHTNAKTHSIIHNAIDRSPLYNGTIQSIGPRYCPSIETKVVTFPDRDDHLLYLEPEGADTIEYYLNGFSSSLPADVQIEALQSIPALRDVEILRPGYAIEYDFFDPTALHHSLESRHVPGLYLAGQVNGTTGYEEAAAQGLIAGINAALSLKGREPLELRRDQAYIGVLIDDLVTKGVDEPYRMFTSRAEYRILLRQDNADRRLTPIGRDASLVDDQRWQQWLDKERQMDALIEYLSTTNCPVDEANAMLSRLGGASVSQPQRLDLLLTRPEVTLIAMADNLQFLGDWIANNIDFIRTAEICEAVESAVKYRGYIDRERQAAEKALRMDSVSIRGRIDYSSVTALSTEARQKLLCHDPATIGHASRIPGISPADINILLLMLR